MSGGIEFGDFEVGGIPGYAQRRGIEPDPLEASAAYGEDPNAMTGASTGDTGAFLEDTDGRQDMGGMEDSGSPDWLSFGNLLDDPAPDGDVFANTAHAAADASGAEPELVRQRVDTRAVEEADPAGAGDTGADTQAGSPAEAEPSGAADALAADPEVAENVTDTAEAVAGSTEVTDDKAADKTAGAVAETLGISIEDAQELVDEALAGEDPDAAEDPEGVDEHDEHGDRAAGMDGNTAAHEHGSEAEAETEPASAKDRLFSFVRGVAAKAGQVTVKEAKEIANGARLVGADIKEWNDGRDDRANLRALDRVRGDLAKGQKKWRRFEKHRSNTNIQAPKSHRNP